MTLFISKFPKAHPDYFSHILLHGDGRGRQRHWLDEAEGTGVCFVSPVDGRDQDFPGRRWICWNKSVERLQKTQKDSENSPNDLRHSLFSEFQGIFCNCSNECIRAFDDQVIWVLPGGCCVSQGTPHVSVAEGVIEIDRSSSGQRAKAHRGQEPLKPVRVFGLVDESKPAVGYMQTMETWTLRYSLFRFEQRCTKALISVQSGGYITDQKFIHSIFSNRNM